FDADGLANGRIVDPGAPGLITLNQLQLSQAQLAQVSPRNADTLSFNVRFSDSVKQVDVSDFKLNFTGNAQGQIQFVEKIYDNLYRVQVNQLGGDGSVALSLNQAANNIV
ncbi:hypothetical protein, partial [Undibacterium fentianense]